MKKVGFMKVSYQGETNYDFIVPEASISEQVDIVLNETVEKANWFSLTLRAIGFFFRNLDKRS
ncbi:hypothetical protein KHA80_10430 [Anaerobacillus sp. HL2]|nr:hypothetical protein KHA80_10430 [Anaerobacillus sp. HL2]